MEYSKLGRRFKSHSGRNYWTPKATCRFRLERQSIPAQEALPLQFSRISLTAPENANLRRNDAPDMAQSTRVPPFAHAAPRAIPSTTAPRFRWPAQGLAMITPPTPLSRSMKPMQNVFGSRKSSSLLPSSCGAACFYSKKS